MNPWLTPSAPGFFATMGVLARRDFTTRDHSGARKSR
jgi:hypothetical protein